MSETVAFTSFSISAHPITSPPPVRQAFSISGAPQGPSRIKDTSSWLKKYLQFPIYLSHGTVVTHTASIWQKFFVVQNVELLVLSSSSWGWIACLPYSIQLHLFPYFGAPRFKSPFVRIFFQKKKEKEKISTRRPGGRGGESLGRKSWRKKIASTQTKKMQQHINRIAIVATGYSETQFPRKIDRRNHE